MIVVKYPTASALPSSSTPDPGVIRAPLGANPVNAPGHRETAPLSASATPRVMHPALNNESWAISYGQARTEPRMERRKGKVRSRKRRYNEKRGR